MRSHRKPYRAVAAALGLLVGGAVAVVLLVGTGRPADTVIPPPPALLVADRADEPGVELAQTPAAALELVGRKMTDARTAGRKGELADWLLRAADLHRELGQDAEARAALVEVEVIREAELAGHWQAREAARRRADLEAEASRPEADRARLRQARELHRSAAALFHQGRYLAAVPVCEKAVGVRRELLSAPHPDLADSLLLLGRLQANRGELYGQAFDTLTAARDMQRLTVGPDHPTHAACLHELAMLEDERGAFVEGQNLYRAALEVFKNSRGEFSPEYARSLARLGRMHANWWVTGAEGEILRAMQIR